MNLIAYLITHESKARSGAVSYSIANKNSTTIVIDNLVGYTLYKINVFAYLGDIKTGTYRMYVGKTINIRTQEGGT